MRCEDRGLQRREAGRGGGKGAGCREIHPENGRGHRQQQKTTETVKIGSVVSGNVGQSADQDHTFHLFPENRTSPAGQ